MKGSNLTILLILTITLSLVSESCIPEGGEITSEQNGPNIVLIVADDLGWSDAGYQGSEIATPRIDKLAESGIRLDRFYVMPTCTPTRVCLLTGKYASRYGVTGPDYGEVIDLGDPTLASILSEQGYYTAIAGKWHLGSPPYTPLKYGFQSSYGYFDGQIDPYTHEYKTETALTGRESWHRNDRYLDESGTHATDLITREAIRVIREKRDQPIFLYVAYSVPHYPLNEPEEWTSEYEGLDLHPSRRWFAASVSHMDDGIGQIMDALDRTGKRENTLVIFMSDNGGQHSWHSETEYRGAYAGKPHRVLGNNFPLRGWKTELYEGGIRVPAVVNWPHVLEPGTVEDPIHVIDWLPTICRMAGCGNAVAANGTDGRDIWPVLTGEKEKTSRTLYWKTPGAFAVMQWPWKLVVDRITGTPELYNLAVDFRESNDLANDSTEVLSQLESILKE